MPLDRERYLEASEKIKTDDIDWTAAGRAGLTADEVATLTYFSDIEHQTYRYLRTLMGMKKAFDPDVMAFLTTWNYEEYFHGWALAKLLERTGNAPDAARVADVYGQKRWNEWLEKLFAPLLSHVFADHFPAVYFSFGAIQELTTLRGYESLAQKASNPALRLLCERIAKQERRHFAWYFNHAKAELEASPFARKLTRALMKFNWVPVGAGVKSPREVHALFGFLFPDAEGNALTLEIDEKMGTLPGLAGMNLMAGYFSALEHRGAPAAAAAGIVPAA